METGQEHKVSVFSGHSQEAQCQPREEEKSGFFASCSEPVTWVIRRLSVSVCVFRRICVFTHVLDYQFLHPASAPSPSGDRDRYLPLPLVGD